MVNDLRPDPWAWLVDGRYLGFTLTFTRGLELKDFLKCCGADPSAVRFLPFAGIHDALRPSAEYSVLRAGTVADWTFGIENLGNRSGSPDILARLSEKTETVSVHCGANAFQLFMYWVDGRPREQFEPGIAATLRAAGPYPFWSAVERYRTDHPGMRKILAVFHAIEDHVGIQIAKETDDGPLASVLISQVASSPSSPASSLPLVYESSRRAGKPGPSHGALQLPATGVSRRRHTIVPAVDAGNEDGIPGTCRDGNSGDDAQGS